MWRTAKDSDDQHISEMCLALYAEDPSPLAVSEQNIRDTLSILRAEPIRGRALVLDVNGAIGGYTILISFWSNELGGEVIVIDELYVRPSYRRRGHARDLLISLARATPLWPGRAVALELEVTPQNKRAAAFYLRVGFTRTKNARMRWVI
jgi:ribosomal protein S18 acetylase RimI-like enzyme